MPRHFLPSFGSTSTVRRVVGLVALVVVLSGCQPCDDPQQYGAIGFVERPGELGVVLVEGVPKPYFYIRDGERDGVSVVWTTDARTFSPPEPMTAGGFDGLGQNQTLCDPSGRCVQADGGGEPSLSLSNRDEWFPAPVPEHRRRVFTRVDECHEVNGAMAAALLPATGELVVAYGQDGLAVLQDGGWDWRAVDGWQRRALLLTEVSSLDAPLVEDLIEDVWFAVFGALLMALVLLLRALGDRRGIGQGRISLWIIGALGGIYIAGWPTAVVVHIFGVPLPLAVTLVGSCIAGLAAAWIGSKLPKPVRRVHLLSAALGAVVGGLVVLVWYAGMPVAWDSAMATAVIASAVGVGVTAHLLRDRQSPRISPPPSPGEPSHSDAI